MQAFRIALAAPALFLIVMDPAPARAEQPATSATDIGVSLSVSSDYVWRGLTQTGGRPAAFAAVTVSNGGAYAGIGTENVDFSGIKQEYDLWGGYVIDLGDVKVDVGASFYGYVSAPQKIDTLELKAGLSGSVKGLNYSLNSFYTRNYFGSGGDGLYVELSSGYKISDGLNLNGSIGRQYLENLPSYTTWNVGLRYDISKNFGSEIRFSNVNGNNYNEIGGRRVYGSIYLGF